MRARTAGRRTQQERSELTTAQLVETAREMFAREGYAASSLEAVAAAAGVTKGAVYHHFSGKAELFEAVFRAEQRRVCRDLAQAYERKRDPLEGLHAGSRAYLEACLDPGFQRIALLDGPSVLGWDRMREVEADYGLALLKKGIQQAIDAGRIRRRDVDSLAHLMFGALCEGAMYVVRAEDTDAARRRFERELRSLIDSLAGE